MRIVFFVLPIILLVIIYLLIGIKFKLLMLIKTDNKSVYYTLNHRFINLVQGKVLVLEGGSLSVITRKSILLSKNPPKGLGKLIALEMLTNINLTRVDIYLDTGRTKDAFVSALVDGGGIVFGEIVKWILENKGTTTNIHYSNNLNRTDYALAIDLNVKITTLKILISLIKAKIKYKKLNLKEKNYAR